MTDEELASACVAVIENFDGLPKGASAELFVRDWRVAGALMEKIHNPIKIICCEETYCVEITVYSSDEEAEPTVTRRFDPNSRSRAIIEACVEVLL